MLSCFRAFSALLAVTAPREEYEIILELFSGGCICLVIIAALLSLVGRDICRISNLSTALSAHDTLEPRRAI